MSLDNDAASIQISQESQTECAQDQAAESLEGCIPCPTACQDMLAGGTLLL